MECINETSPMAKSYQDAVLGTMKTTLANSVLVLTSYIDRFVSCKIYDKRDDFDFEIVNFPFLDGDVPGVAS